MVMADSRNQIPQDGPVEVTGLPDRSEDLSLLKQGPMTRITLWKEIVEDGNVNSTVKGHYFEDSGLLLIDLHNGEQE